MQNKKMDKKELEIYRKTLLEMKEHIVRGIKHISEDTSDTHKDASASSGHALHMADVATDMYDREFSLGIASNGRELLQKVEQALKRIDDQTFGSCLECGGAILLARLKALPYVQTCLKCQEKLESKR